MWILAVVIIGAISILGMGLISKLKISQAILFAVTSLIMTLIVAFLASYNSAHKIMTTKDLSQEIFVFNGQVEYSWGYIAIIEDGKQKPYAVEIIVPLGSETSYVRKAFKEGSWILTSVSLEE